LTPHAPARLSRRTALTLTAAAVASPAHAQFGDLVKQLTQTGATTPATPPTTPPPGAAQVAVGPQGVVPRGYSERFLPVRTLIGEGRYAEALHAFAPPAKTPADAPEAGAAPAAGPIVNDPFLTNAEMGLLEFEGGEPDQAALHLRAAEDSQTARRDAKGMQAAETFLSDIGHKIVGVGTGQEEFAAYHPLDHERILQLNYLSLAYLLQGQRQCYNITRRCIDEQTALKAKFDVEIEAAKAKYAEQSEDKSKVSDSDRTAIDGLANQFKAYDSEAGRVPNAYVNPLGDYLAAVIQEIVAKEQPALRDNSRIAYLNAVKLCGHSAQLSAAAAAMARPRPPANERVLHVIAGEGFAPSRDVLTFGLTLKGQVVPVRVPIFKPVPSPINRISVHLPNGTMLGTLDPIGDFEAIRLRDQHDRIPAIMLGVFSSSLASYFSGKATDRLGWFGQVAHSVRNETASPDTRSWLSLPRRFHVARLSLPHGVQSVTLVAYDDAGRRIGSQPAPVLSNEAQSVLYARVTKESLRVQAARRLWIEGRLEDVQA
jgi:hypothetical protein